MKALLSKKQAHRPLSGPLWAPQGCVCWLIGCWGCYFFLLCVFYDFPEDQDLENTRQDEDDLAAITLEWVEEMEERIEASLGDVETSIQRLHQLCKRILTADANKTKTLTKGKRS